MKCLIIREPWIDMILSGEKLWEMRSRGTNIRGTIGLIKAGSGLIVGECILAACLRNIPKEDLMGYKFSHRVTDQELLNKWCIPWVLTSVNKYKNPIPYDHPKGAVTWVNVDLGD